jgi:hypothetical protein
MRNNKYLKDSIELDRDNYTLLIHFEYIEERETNYKGLDILQVLYNGITDVTLNYLDMIDEDELEEEIINSLDI